MPSCKQRELLTIEWHEAVAKFSDAVIRLRKCNGDGTRFATQHRATDLARLHSENARMMLEHHRTEHGC